MREEWRDVVGYEGRYQVSNLGNIKSVARSFELVRLGKTVLHNTAERILKPAPMDSRHLQVSLTKNGASKSFLVHLIVLTAFVGVRPGGSVTWQGCHGDGDPTNNKVGNLRWDTRSGNEMDKVAHGRSNRGVRNRASKLDEEKVREIKARISRGEESPAIAPIYGVTRGAINAIKRGRAWGWL